MTERNASVSRNDAVKAHLENYKTKNFKEIAALIGMKPDSFYQKINNASNELRVATTIFADPDVEGETVRGAELMQRLNVDYKTLDKDASQTVITVGKSLPKSVSAGTTQRSTGGSQSLVDLFDSLTSVEDADASAETAEDAESDGEDSDSESE